MKHFTDLIAECLSEVDEVMPWDLAEKLQGNPELMMVDVREPYEFDALHIPGSINIPRGILETACEWDYEETVPALVEARDKEVIVICRSGNRSVLAAYNMKRMGYRQAVSLKTGVRGWNDYEQTLIDKDGQEVDIDDADEILANRIRPDQRRPAA